MKAVLDFAAVMAFMTDARAAGWEVIDLMSRNDEADAIHVHVSGGEDFLWLSEKAERRLMRVMIAVMALAVSPVFVMAFLM